MNTPKDTEQQKAASPPPLDPVDSEWGQTPNDHFGYASDEERLAKRGLEDWELVDRIPESQRGVPIWFFSVVIVVLLVAVGLSFPFWGDRPGYEREWVNWGFAAALLYLAVAGGFVYFMVHLYGSRFAGRLDSDKSGTKEQQEEGKGGADTPDTGKG